MKLKIKIAYGLLLVLVLMAMLIPAVGQSQARYQNTEVWNTVLTELPDQVTSDCLGYTDELPVIILLEEMAADTPRLDVSFTLQSGVEVAGPLSWSVDRPGYADAKLYLNGRELNDEETVVLTDTPVTVTVSVFPTEDAFDEPRDALEINVKVTWGNTLAGTFRTRLAEVPAPETVSPTEAAENADVDPAADSGETETTDPTETAESSGGEEESSTEPSQAEEPQPTEPPTVQTVNPETYSPEEGLSLELTPSQGVTRMEIGLLQITPATQERTGSVELLPLPAYTRFRYADGKQQYLLPGETLLNPEFTPGQTTRLVLDFSDTALAGQELELALVYYGEEENPLNILGISSSPQAPEPECRMESRVLTENMPVTLEVPAQWLSLKPDWTIHWWNGQEYKEVFYLEPVVNLALEQMEIAFDEASRPLAGRYLLTVRWMDGQTCVGETEEVFFVVYSDYNETIKTGGAEQ